MELFTAILIGAIVVRVVLDFATSTRSNSLFDTLYVVLFGVAGIVMLFKDSKDTYGYVSIAIAIGWAWFGITRAKKISRDKSKDNVSDVQK